MILADSCDPNNGLLTTNLIETNSFLRQMILKENSRNDECTDDNDKLTYENDRLADENLMLKNKLDNFENPGRAYKIASGKIWKNKKIKTYKEYTLSFTFQFLEEAMSQPLGSHKSIISIGDYGHHSAHNGERDRWPMFLGNTERLTQFYLQFTAKSTAVILDIPEMGDFQPHNFVIQAYERPDGTAVGEIWRNGIKLQEKVITGTLVTNDSVYKSMYISDPWYKPALEGIISNIKYGPYIHKN